MPNLHRATNIVHRSFEDIVIGGSREAEGMPSYEGLLTSEDVRLIHAYILSRARAAIEEANALTGPDSVLLPAGIYILSIAGADEGRRCNGRP